MTAVTPLGLGLGLVFLVALVPAMATATEIVQTDVTQDHGQYRIVFEVLLDANADKVRQYMTDYAHLDRLSDTVIADQVLGKQKNGLERIKLVLHSCIFIFCKTMTEVEDVAVRPDGDIVTTVVPEQSDFSLATEHWQILPEQNQTRIKYDAVRVPRFFIPPIIGPLIVKAKIRKELATSAMRLEQLAHSP